MRDELDSFDLSFGFLKMCFAQQKDEVKLKKKNLIQDFALKLPGLF